ncbi:MAG TPA: hypothetical protein VHD56_15240 [Tepidisphaeraceae bacterium]|nr:hypothetical protein [Tepidisphaeraceae bacterium]
MSQLIDLMGEQIRIMSWIPVIIVALLAAVIGWNGWTRPDVRAGWFILFVQLAAYSIVYLITPWELPVLIPITAPRLMLQVTPLAMLLVAMHWSAAESEPIK